MSLRGEEEMRADVARHVGVSEDDPFIDALRMRFYAPLVAPKQSGRYRGDYYYALESYGEGGLESVPASYGSKGMSSPSLSSVGMGAGVLMAQRHEKNETVKASDFRPTPFHEIVFRLVWVEEWNALARLLEDKSVVITDKRLEQLELEQRQYEVLVKRSFGIFQDADTKVDAFPTVP